MLILLFICVEGNKLLFIEVNVGITRDLLMQTADIDCNKVVTNLRASRAFILARTLGRNRKFSSRSP